MTKVASASWHRFSLALDRFHSICEKHLFSLLNFHLLLFGIHLMAASGVPFMFEMDQKALRLHMFREIKGGHVEARGCGDKNNDHPKRTPKSPLGIYEKHWFSLLILHLLLFGIHLVAASGAPIMFKMVQKALVLWRFGCPAWAQHWAIKEAYQIVSNGFGTSWGPKSYRNRLFYKGFSENIQKQLRL